MPSSSSGYSNGGSNSRTRTASEKKRWTRYKTHSATTCIEIQRSVHVCIDVCVCCCVRSTHLFCFSVTVSFLPLPLSLFLDFRYAICGWNPKVYGTHSKFAVCVCFVQTKNRNNNKREFSVSKRCICFWKMTKRTKCGILWTIRLDFRCNVNFRKEINHY